MKQRVLIEGVNGDARSKPFRHISPNEAGRRYRRTIKGKKPSRKNNAKRNYGISLEEYERLRALATYCPVCGVELMEKSGSGASKHLDHNHLTGVIRGILCADCNLALGHMKDNVEAILHLAEWAKR